MTNQLVSYFYLITLEHKPVYVGYTNRPIKQRFAEHKRDKDFGDIEPEITLLDTLSFDFSWDIRIINDYAQQVDDRERELIAEYGTQNSVYQKAIGGGQTWADVKHFVRTNRDNPKFTGLADDEILAMVAQANALRRQFLSVIYGTRPSEEVRLRNVISHTEPAEKVRLRNVINNTIPAEEMRLKSVINNTKPIEEKRLKHIVYDTKPTEEMRLRNVIGGVKTSEGVRLKSVISNVKSDGKMRWGNIIDRTQTKQENQENYHAKHTKHTRNQARPICLSRPSASD